MSGYFTAVSNNVPANVPTTFVTNSGSAVPSGNSLNVFGGGGTTTSGSGATVTITSTATVLNWNDQNADFLASVNEGYFCTAALTVTLPASPSQGNMVQFISDTASAVTIQANTGQYIAIGAETSTQGGSGPGTGKAISTALGDNLILVYRSASSTWRALEADATWTLT